MKHPATFSASILDTAANVLYERGFKGTLLDPFAGVGKIHSLQNHVVSTIGVEIEPEWANMHFNTIIGDALYLPFPTRSVEGIFTSPCYGNRMADHHNAKDGSKRVTYKHYLGRDLHESNSGKLQWGSKYKTFHEQAWKEASRVVQDLFILNISDHIRNDEVVPVSEWHVDILSRWFNVEKELRIKTPRMKFGANYNARVEYESLFILTR